MKHFLLILISPLFFSTPLFAQWTKIDTISSQHIVALALDGDTILAVPRGNVLYKSIDQGATWTTVKISDDTIKTITIKLIDNVIYIGTIYHGIFMSKDHGRNWVNTGTNLLAVSGIEKVGTHLYASTLGQGVVIFDSISLNWKPFNTELPDYSANVYTLTKTSKGLIIGAGRNGTNYKYDTTTNEWIEGYYYGFLKPNLQIDQILCEHDTLFAVNGSKIFRSNDGGEHWLQDKQGTQDGYSRSIRMGITNYFIVTNTLQGGTFIQQRDKFAADSATWALYDEYLPDGYAYDILDLGNKLFLGKTDGLYVKNLFVGITEPLSQESVISISPNPLTEHLLTISGTHLVVSLSIYNSIGQAMQETHPGKAEFILETDLNKGVYFVKMLLSNGQSVLRKIVVD
ncbi:MAG: T9SS type A sorting domain-containing protein [Bacteroidota bacterium]